MICHGRHMQVRLDEAGMHQSAASIYLLGTLVRGQYFGLGTNAYNDAILNGDRTGSIVRLIPVSSEDVPIHDQGVDGLLVHDDVIPGAYFFLGTAHWLPSSISAWELLGGSNAHFRKASWAGAKAPPNAICEFIR